MVYRNLMAELARNGMSKQDLHIILNDKGCKISYQKLCRQLRGEVDIPFGQAGLMSHILKCDVQYMMVKEEQ